MNKELIEKLQRNEKPFGLLSPEDQQSLRKLEKHAQYFWAGKWINKYDKIFFDGCTYRLSPDYLFKKGQVKDEVEVIP